MIYTVIYTQYNIYFNSSAHIHINFFFLKENVFDLWQTNQTKIHDRQNSAASNTAINVLLVDLPQNISLPSAHFHNSAIMLICLT